VSRPPKPDFKTGILPTSTVSAVADLADYAADPPAVLARRIAAQSITSGLATAVVFDGEMFDNADMFAPSSDTINIVDSGFYTVHGWVDLQAGTTGIRQLEIFQNGAAVWSDARNAPSSLTNRMTISGPVVATAGDTLQLWVYQSQGSSLNVTAAKFAAVRTSG
jgi:hypothetical protein